jgi:hypothetical protein
MSASTYHSIMYRDGKGIWSKTGKINNAQAYTTDETPR